MAILVKTHFNQVIGAFCQRLLVQGKAQIFALFTWILKLFFTLNAILKHNQPWQPQPTEVTWILGYANQL
jgi:hypothetical protein